MTASNRVKAGEPIRASTINAALGAARRLENTPSAPGASIHFAPDEQLATKIYVVSRSVETQTPLDMHAYSVSDGVNVFDIDWTQIMVDVQPDLVGPEASVQQLFVPAEIAGEGRALSEAWRSWGLLYRGPSPDGSGETVAAVKLFGLSPHRGC